MINHRASAEADQIKPKAPMTKQKVLAFKHLDFDIWILNLFGAYDLGLEVNSNFD